MNFCADWHWPAALVAEFTPLRAPAACEELGVSTLLSDSFDDFVTLSSEPDADLPALLDEFEAQLNHYADKEWGYNPKVFPLLRKAARGYVSGKLSRRALEAVSKRTLLWYVCEEGSEEELVEDLRGYIRAKPTNDLRAVVAQIIGRRRAATARPEQGHRLLHSVPALSQPPAGAKFPVRTATTSTGVVLTVVK